MAIVGPLEPSDAIALLARMARHIAELHSIGRAYGVIGPQTVMIDLEGLDARIDPDEVASPDPAYRSPERLLFDTPSPSDDTWALCAVLYFALTGCRPYPGDSNEEVLERLDAGPIAPLAVYGVDDEGLEGLLIRGLSRDQSARLDDAERVAGHLETWLQKRGIPLRPVPSISEPPTATHDGSEESTGDSDDVLTRMAHAEVPTREESTSDSDDVLTRMAHASVHLPEESTADSDDVRTRAARASVSDEVATRFAVPDLATRDSLSDEIATGIFSAKPDAVAALMEDSETSVDLSSLPPPPKLPEGGTGITNTRGALFTMSDEETTIPREDDDERPTSVPAKALELPEAPSIEDAPLSARLPSTRVLLQRAKAAADKSGSSAPPRSFSPRELAARLSRSSIPPRLNPPRAVRERAETHGELSVSGFPLSTPAPPPMGDEPMREPAPILPIPLEVRDEVEASEKPRSSPPAEKPLSEILAEASPTEEPLRPAIDDAPASVKADRAPAKAKASAEPTRGVWPYAIVGGAALVVVGGYVLSGPTTELPTPTPTPLVTASDAPREPIPSASSAAVSASAIPLVAPPSTSASAQPSSSATVPTGDVSACVVPLFPSETFMGDAPDFSFVCEENDPREGGTRVREALVRAGSGRAVTDGMKEWALMGYYELAAYATLRGRCCPSPSPLEVPSAPEVCESMQNALNGIVKNSKPGSTEAQQNKAVKVFDKSLSCILKTRKSAAFGNYPKPSGGEKTAYGKTLQRLREAP